MKRFLVCVLFVLVAFPLFADDPKVPARYKCAPSGDTDKKPLEKIFCANITEAFDALNFVDRVPEDGKHLKKVYFDFQFSPVQASDNIVAVGVHVGFVDTRLNGLQFSVFHGTMLFIKPTADTVVPNTEPKGPDKDVFNMLANDLFALSKEWFFKVKPTLEKMRVQPVIDPSNKIADRSL